MNTNTLTTVTQQSQETLNTILIDILRGVKSSGAEIYEVSKVGLGKTVDFVAEQAPQVIQEFLKWKFSEAIIYMVVSAIILIFSVWFLKKMRLYWESVPPSVVFPVVFILVSSGIFICNTMNMIKITVAPRVYIIEYVTDAISSKSNSRH